MAVQRGRYSEVLFALMLVFVGLLFATHGAQKLFGFPGAHPMPLKPLTLAAGIIEFGCGLLVALGLLTRIAAFVASGEMAVAYLMVHAKGGFWPIINKGELAVAYCFVFLFIAAHGAGRYSLDAAIRGRPGVALRAS
jgi:putative oxidoreductase